jgi:hypothetical protein
VDVRSEGGPSGEAKAWNNGAEDGEAEDGKAKHRRRAGSEDDRTGENGKAIDGADVGRPPVDEVRGKVTSATPVCKKGGEAIEQHERFAQDRGEARRRRAADDRAAQECRPCRSIEEAGPG